MLDDFLSLIFPKLCASCGRALQLKEECICTFCHYQLPQTDYHLQVNNPVSKLFWGRANINTGASLYTFSKGGKVENLIHELKYKGREDIGFVLGRFYGARLNESELFRSVDLVLSIPIHENKIKKRGYNQSDSFAKGISEGMGINYDDKSLKRIVDSDTQTNRSRYERWENVKSTFGIEDERRLQGKHILLVDDVITTGATLEASAEVLLRIPNTLVSVATFCYAEI